MDTDEAGDQWISHVVPMLDGIELGRDHAREPVVYDPDGSEPIENYRDDDPALEAISYAHATQDAWTGQRPYINWGWHEQPEDLTLIDGNTQAGDPDEDDDPDDDPE